MTSTTLSNVALADEIEALNSIYDDKIIDNITTTESSTVAILKLPTQPFSFRVSFPPAYPDDPPIISGVDSVGDTEKGAGAAILTILRDVLYRAFVSGQVCLYDLIEEVSPLLDGETEAGEDTRSEEISYHEQSLTDSASHLPPGPPPPWTLSDPITFNRSTFLARACPASSLGEATSAVSHLLATDRRAASATHNITAWRIQNGNAVIQDCDDDGETAAGGRLLHLMQLMDAWNVVVVVTRWYGGVKLGPDRFRLINQVARDALVKGGWSKGKDDSKSAKAKEKSKK